MISMSGAEIRNLMLMPISNKKHHSLLLSVKFAFYSSMDLPHFFVNNHCQNTFNHLIQLCRTHCAKFIQLLVTIE